MSLTAMLQPAPLILRSTTISSIQTFAECASPQRVVSDHKQTPKKFPAIKIVSRSAAPSLLNQKVCQITDQQPDKDKLKAEVTDRQASYAQAVQPSVPKKRFCRKKPPLHHRFKEVGMKRL